MSFTTKFHLNSLRINLFLVLNFTNLEKNLNSLKLISENFDLQNYLLDLLELKDN